MIFYLTIFAIFIKEFYRYFYYEDYEIIVNKMHNQINDLVINITKDMKNSFEQDVLN